MFEVRLYLYEVVHQPLADLAAWLLLALPVGDGQLRLCAFCAEHETVVSDVEMVAISEEAVDMSCTAAGEELVEAIFGNQLNAVYRDVDVVLALR